MQEPPVTATDPAEPKGLSWGLESRLQFIDFRLRWERRINRMDLTEHFGISVPQASLDIAKYTELAPSNLTYDRSSKTYTAAPSFHPLYQRSSAQRYLAELLATKMGVVEPAASFIGSAPETDWAPSPWRTINEQTVEAVVRAIRQQEAIRVSYQSMTSLDESIRLLSPHALGNDGFRWHVRAFCHKRQRFSDFSVGSPFDCQIQHSDFVAAQTLKFCLRRSQQCTLVEQLLADLHRRMDFVGQE